MDCTYNDCRLCGICAAAIDRHIGHAMKSPDEFHDIIKFITKKLGLVKEAKNNKNVNSEMILSIIIESDSIDDYLYDINLI